MWNPTCKVFINGGTEYTSETIADVSITYGKTDITQKFRPSFASITLISDDAGLPVVLNDDCIIKLQNSSATDVTIFTGVVTDIVIEMISPTWIQTRLTLASKIAHFGSLLVGYNGYPEEGDGDRIISILADANELTWVEVAGSWADQEGTWNLYEAVAGNIETNPIWVLHAYNGEPGYATDFLQIVEDSGLGWVYETPDGKINYNAADRGSTFNTLSPDQVLLSGTRAEINTQYTNTAVEVSNYLGETYLGSINAGVAAYSRIVRAVKTWLKQKAQLPYWMKLYLSRFSFDYPNLSSFTVPLSQLTNVQRDALIGINVGYGVSITGLPTAIWTGAYEGFVEGYTWRIQTGEAFLTLNISPKQQSKWFNNIGPAVPPDSDFIFTDLP